MALVAAMRAADFAEHPYAWVITRDRDHELHGGSESTVGVTGPAQATEEMERLARTQGRRFRLLDEGDIDEAAEFDGKVVDPAERGVVYEGLIWTADPPGSETDVAPLRDWGEPYYGCVTVQYLTDRRWISL